MDDSLLVRRFERVGDLFGDGQRFVERDGAAARSARARSSPSTSSITERVSPPCFFEAVDGGDVRMIQRGERSWLRAGSAPRGRGRAANSAGGS